MKGFPDLPPLWLAGFMVLAWILAAFAPLATFDGFGQRVLGIGVALAGVGLIGWAALWFRRKRTTIEPHHSPGTLIVEGPYRLGRNPIYLGMVLILAGQVVWLGALSPVLLPPALLVILGARFAAPEEAGLIAAFGDEGRAYLAATRRWV